MKKVLLFASGLLFCGASDLQAQNWVNKGNTLIGNGIIGLNSNHSLLFETNNTERGRITNTGLWGIGTGTTLPNAKFHINGAIGQDALRVQVNKKTKLLVSKTGGVSIGAGVAPPVDGLYVAGNVAIGTTTPYHLTKLTVLNEDEALATAIRAVGEKTGMEAIGGSYGVYGEGSSAGVYGTAKDYGIQGEAASGGGVLGVGGDDGAHGVVGGSKTGFGGYFMSNYGDGLVASTNDPSNRYAGYFDGPIFTTASFVGSDKTIQKNIQEIGNATSILNKLKPNSYQFQSDGKNGALRLPAGNHYGLIAQEVEQVLPNLVKETTHEVSEPKPGFNGKLDPSAINQASKELTEKVTIKAVNYTELIPIMIKGMQEQQAKMQEQQAKIEELTLLVQKFSQKDISALSVKPLGASLSQSAPNPSKNSTKINYSIPAGSTKALLVITNATGQQIKKVTLNDSGSVEVDTTSLSAGTYLYSLFIDDALVATEKMVVAK